MQLSDNPELLKQQLIEIVIRSEQSLQKLTSPVLLFDPVELKQDYLISSDYQPPSKRYAKISYY